jgi:hypothetical protein
LHSLPASRHLRTNYNTLGHTILSTDETWVRPVRHSHPLPSRFSTPHFLARTPTPTLTPTPTPTHTQPTIACSPFINHIRITFTSVSGATDILVTQRDSEILINYAPYTHRPGFSIANLSTIYPIATGKLRIPHTSVLLTACVFRDTDLFDNLFGLATSDQPWIYSHLLTHGYFRRRLYPPHCYVWH